jgi:hypothetical protein
MKYVISTFEKAGTIGSYGGVIEWNELADGAG